MSGVPQRIVQARDACQSKAEENQPKAPDTSDLMKGGKEGGPPRSRGQGSAAQSSHAPPFKGPPVIDLEEAAEKGPQAKSSKEDGAAQFPQHAPAGRTQMEEAKALIDRFKIEGGPVVLHPSLVGFDCSNRDGIPMDGHRCDALLESIADMGWEPEEADFGNVAVQERPGSSELLEHNRRACLESEFLAEVKVDHLAYGTLSHSHLHQCLKNLLAGAPAKAPQQFIVNGRLSMEAVSRLQPALARSAQTGLKWTVLHWSIRDQPGALTLIQSAANRRASVAMKETTMQTVARLSAICHRARGEGLKVDYNVARRELAKSMPEMAQSPEFLPLLRFVVNLGGEDAQFIPYLKAFVGLRGKNRSVKPTVFSIAGRLGPKVPHVMAGLIIMAYSAPKAFFDADGYSRYLSLPEVAAMVDKDTEEPKAPVKAGEQILRWFHRACEELKGSPKVSEQKRVDFMGRLDSIMLRLLCGKHLGNVYHERCPTIEHVAQAFHDELVAWAPPETRAFTFDKPWIPPAAGNESRAGAKEEPRSQKTELLPTLIRFEDGQAVTEQELLVEEVSEEAVQWAGAMQYSQEELAKAQLLIALDSATTALAEWMKDRVAVKRTSMGDIVVYAKCDLAAGGIALVPSVNAAAFVEKHRDQKEYPPTVVEVADWMGFRMVILPCTKVPPKGTTVEGWNKPSFMPPFWLLSRNSDPLVANCALSTIRATDLQNYFLGDGGLKLPRTIITKDRKGAIPIITNTRPLDQGSELVLKVDPPPKRDRPTKMTRSWEGAKVARRV